MKNLLRVACLLLVSMTAVQAGQAREQGFRASLSVSPYTEMVIRKGMIFTDGATRAETTEQLERMFRAHGGTEVYTRVATRWRTQPGNGDYSLDRALERAVLAKALGLPFNPELGLFSIYGDIRGEPAPDFSDYPLITVPGAWHTLTLEQMVSALTAYGSSVSRAILNTGVRVLIWDIGNEVEFGVAGVAPRPQDPSLFNQLGGYQSPDRIDPEIGRMSEETLLKMSEADRIAWLQAHLWPVEAKLLAAVAAGIRTVDPAARFSTHLSGHAALAPKLAVAFFEAMRDGGYQVDEIGLSYFPTSSWSPPDRLEAFKNTVTLLYRTLGRPVFIAKYGYPSGPMSDPFPWNATVPQYPQTPSGQAAFTYDLSAWGISSGMLSGIRPWAPELADFAWRPMAFFHAEGHLATANPALDAISSALRARSSKGSLDEMHAPGSP
ncbi:glycosyl hydrolase 53 family protein [Rhodopila sp.]|uniref:glycosyl hydrolase 53 family protein n=1 Tax=Rhodopila sp. TaxID=2480087 RepID=UPI003D0AE411